MSSVAIVQPRTLDPQTYNSSPCVNVNQFQKSRITKGFHLANQKKESAVLPKQPIKGVSLLAYEINHISAPHTTPRQENEEPQEYYQLSKPRCENNVCEEEADLPLTLYGERLEAAGSFRMANSRPFVSSTKLRTGNETGTSECETSYMNTVINDDGLLDDTGPRYHSLTPAVPPATPSFQIRPHVKGFQIDGMHLDCSNTVRSASSRDFTPGFIKRPGYCCDKCEIRMVGHESLNMETCCPFQAYQRKSRLSMASDENQFADKYNDLYSLPFYGGFPACNSTNTVYHEDHVTEHIKMRSKSVAASIQKAMIETPRPYTSTTMSVLTPTKNGKQLKDDIVSQSSSCSSQSDDSEDSLCNQSEHEQINPASMCTLNNEHGSCVNTKRNILYLIPSVDKRYQQQFEDTVDKEKLERTMDIPAVVQYPLDPENRQKKPDEGQIHWKDVWNLEETLVSPLPTHPNASNMTSYSRNSVILSDEEESDRNSYTNDDDQTSRSDERPIRISSRDDLHDFLKDCAESLLSVSYSHRKGEVEYGYVQKNSSSMFPDICGSSDLCYQPMTDKRYNKWRRRKRKKTSAKTKKTSSECDSSSDEKDMKNALPENIRRRRKSMEKSLPHTWSSNNASSESSSDPFPSSLRDGLSKHSSSVEGSFLFSPDDQSLPTELSSFPALSSYHASNHGTYASVYRKSEEKIQNESVSTLEPPLVISHQISTVENFFKSKEPIGNSFASIKRYPNSLARNTLCKMNYSIGEKILKSMESESNNLQSLYTKVAVNPGKTPQMPRTRVIMSSKLVRPRKLKQLSSNNSLPDPEIQKPNLSTLTLNHLLQTMPGATVNKEDTSDKEKNTQKKQINAKPEKELKSKKPVIIDRRRCLGSKIPPTEKTEMAREAAPVKIRSIPNTLSSLDFTPAFTFSMFELPHFQKMHNITLQRKASSFK